MKNQNQYCDCESPSPKEQDDYVGDELYVITVCDNDGCGLMVDVAIRDEDDWKEKEPSK